MLTFAQASFSFSTTLYRRPIKISLQRGYLYSHICILHDFPTGALQQIVTEFRYTVTRKNLGKNTSSLYKACKLRYKCTGDALLSFIVNSSRHFIGWSNQIAALPDLYQF